jgi:hypothetical protein
VIEKISNTLNLSLTRIGQITAIKNSAANMEILTSDGKPLCEDDSVALMKSFDHFK